MNIIMNTVKGLFTLGITAAITMTSLSTQAASREDVAIGVIAGVATGYILSQQSDDVRIVYRNSDYGHRHYYSKHHHKHSKHHHKHHNGHHHDGHWAHDSYRGRYNHSRKHEQYKSRWSNDGGDRYRYHSDRNRHDHYGYQGQYQVYDRRYH